MNPLTVKLADIQQKINVPKLRRNTFGNFNFRNCEDILDAAKPLLNGLVILITDEVIQVGDRFYIKATASITDGEHTISTMAQAREPLTKKGMDESQITTATSSYARKSALGGLLMIDDSTHDPDSQNNSQNTEVKKITPKQVGYIEDLLKRSGRNKTKFLQYYKINKIEDIQQGAGYDDACAILQSAIDRIQQSS